MSKSYSEAFKAEEAYFTDTLALVGKELERETERLDQRKSGLKKLGRGLWEDAVHFSNDFDRMTEINQQLNEVTNQTSAYSDTIKKIQGLKRASRSPYFARFDFTEEGSDYREKIYIGLQSVIDSSTRDIRVYDWRAPISAIFYRYEPGEADYSSPYGEVRGMVSLKRQYGIKAGKLEYFFDCSIRINDQMLQKVLGKNTSAAMRNIVETIQRDQDRIIRDMENELLIVQGVAGSGKTSIALHRIAYLLYEGMESRLEANNILIISPNKVFSQYISGVLPELGEANVEQTTFDDIAESVLKEHKLQTRHGMLEELLNKTDTATPETNVKYDFKGSDTFLTILDRLVRFYEHKFIEFQDIYYHGTTLATRQQLKAEFLNNSLGLPAVKRFRRMEEIIFQKLHPLQRKRLPDIQKVVARHDGHELEIKAFSRLLSIKEAARIRASLKSFMDIDYLKLYKMLFNNSSLFMRLARGLTLPAGIDAVLTASAISLEGKEILYEDCAPLMYLRLRLEGSDYYKDIKQVLVDEAQDYTFLQYEVFRLLFGKARFTVLGDIYQAIEKQKGMNFYENVIKILKRKSSVIVTMNKSYRASWEINRFVRQIQGAGQDFIPFERHEPAPRIVCSENEGHMVEEVLADISRYRDKGFETIAVICKTWTEAFELFKKLKGKIEVSLLGNEDTELEKGVFVTCSYMSKGLEFDVVFVYGADNRNYKNDLDRRLLYISCSRALHRLILYYSGQQSLFIKDKG